MDHTSTTKSIVIEYDSKLIKELKTVYGKSVNVALNYLTKPPERYYFRVNVLRISPGDLLDEMRSLGYEVYVDEMFSEALWFPVRGPQKLSEEKCQVIVDKRTAESVMLGANVYAPGVIRLVDCTRPGDYVSIVSPNDIIVGNGVLVKGFEENLRAGRGLVVKNVRPLYHVPSLRSTKWYIEGYIYEQSISSMMVAHVLSPRPNTVIVDMCAAPGGKASHVYELAVGRVRVIALDHSRSKIAKMRSEFRRLGHRIESFRMDSRYADQELGEGFADYVILDPPCSSLGVIPKVYDKKTYSDIINFARYQRQFIRSAYRLLKPGGVLVYSTCTITLLENEENIAYAVEELGFGLEDVEPKRWSRGIGPYGYYAQRVHPHIHGATGYFIAKLVKK